MYSGSSKISVMEGSMTKKAVSGNKPTEELEALRLRITELETQLAKNTVNSKTTPFEDGGIYKAIFESANDSILFIDKKGKIEVVPKNWTGCEDRILLLK
jgi:hypothetical protein